MKLVIPYQVVFMDIFFYLAYVDHFWILITLNIELIQIVFIFYLVNFHYFILN